MKPTLYCFVIVYFLSAFSVAKGQDVIDTTLPLEALESESEVEITSPGYMPSRNPGSTAAANPTPQTTVYNTNNIQLTMDNRGNYALGEFFAVPFGRGITIRDPFSGERVTGCVYPRGTGTRFMMQGSLMIGGVVGRDTLVSFSRWETFPEAGSFGNFDYASTNIADSRFETDAISDMDITTVFLDTFPTQSPGPWFDFRAHKPLGLKITQRAHAWTSAHLDDFIIFDYTVENISGKHIRDAYVGFYNMGVVQTVTGRVDSTALKSDDVVGHLSTYPAPEGCDLLDTINVAYSMDNDGDPLVNAWPTNAARGALGFKWLKLPSQRAIVNFNWWASGFGPRKRNSADDPYRSDIVPFENYSASDVMAYYHLAHREFDYDQLTTWQSKFPQGWEAPPTSAANIADGARPYYLSSAGPFDLPINGAATFTVVMVGGVNVHVNPWDFRNTFSYSNASHYINALDFSNFSLNARWAEWIFDNPGVDTDDDGFSGKFRLCNDDTLWYKGDGVPDFRTDNPPQRPFVRVIPRNGKLVVRWNGFYTETTKDALAGLHDFEGYRIYKSLDGRESSFTLLSSWDKENYVTFKFRLLANGDGVWQQQGTPETVTELRERFANPNLEPLQYTRANALFFNNEHYYFAPQDFNAFELNRPGGIQKVYPQVAHPGLDAKKWSEDDVIYDYEEPMPKYFEYEYVIDSLLPSVPYFVTVTAFDFGSPTSGVLPLETRKTDNMIREYAQTSSDSVEALALDVYVYPNPWRGDGNYERAGFENRDESQASERAHRLHFANLPRVCTIRIYSLDGDLVREIEHNYPDGGPESQHETWDLITRNTQAAVSGIYYYSVESESRTQIGKFAIIK